MPFDLNDFLAQGLVFGGARSSKFDVQVSIPPALTGTINGNFPQKLNFTCKAASIPPFRVGTVEIPYFGRKIKSAGDRTWDNWNITVMLDEDYSTRAAFEAWNNSINTLESNILLDPDTGTSIGLPGSNETESYKSNWTITHYAKDTNIIRQYTLIGGWPPQIGPIELDWEAGNRISQFQVIVAFDWLLPTWEQGEGGQGDSSYLALASANGSTASQSSPVSG